ncbi:hypothetical protein FT663_04040 [Candidozyma haemuli var. vulneris]|uniref:SEC7 domain-containing protein n=1 Tax=Candidozyma haemuli TaxID=45357 RepID=A0A2V1APR4_9ASCO|nr:hypothetical protein CXQ85_003362 [[Candida] haemuloni]KAF3987219.1 hypothetical protein FT662_04121 [[Candida] haemuloni var. vulneris]KAF3988428.1 hypothetical protein FT663_04040 [[Candida] haemuloni var. vulneris]PVH19516.1 hypothetical protein CXQ85_003362 [[Candida] haemuloni]
MRKMSRWPQTGVAAILGGGDLFGEEDGLSNLGLSSSHFGSAASTPRVTNGGTANPNTSSNPLHSSFLQLRAILTETSDIHSVDSLTILQPFLLAVESSSTSGNVTGLALNAINKFLDYGVVGWNSKNIQNSLIQITSSLTHCRFEAADQSSDDSVLLKVLRLLESIVDSSFSKLLPNAVVSEVIQTCLSLACNKRRSEVLRRAAEMAMISMTIRVFSRLRELTPETSNMDDLPTNYAENQLPADVIGGTNSPTDDTSAIAQDIASGGADQELKPPTVDLAPVSPKRKPSMSDEKEPQFDIACINEFFAILISMISPSNQYQHMESTRVFALSLINIAIEVSGSEIPKHPSLMGLVADPVSKDVLQIITVTDSPPLLSAALRLFSTMAIILGKNIKSQIELTFNLLFHSILPPDTSKDNTIKGNKMAISTRIASSKEAIVESLSLLWIRSPQFFSSLFVDYDCDFERFNMAADFVNFLCKLALPEAAVISTDNVPPICLEGILSLVAGINDRIKNSESSSARQSKEHPHQLLVDKDKKTAFVRCTELFNENPKKGVAALAEKKFLEDPNDTHELASLLFNKSARLNKKILGEYLAKPSNTELLKEFMNLFEFAGLRVDEALRLLLKSFRLPGESQQIERIVELFAQAYVECQKSFTPEELTEEEKNEPVNPDQDAVFVLSYSIIMLNTDLHNPQVKRQMDLDSYKRNLKGVNNGKDFPEWYLSKIYSSIRDREIIMPEEHHGTDKWFDDVWHNLISSQTRVTRDRDVSLESIDVGTLCQFDKLFFESSVDVIIETLIKVFSEASDDNIITKLMSSIDKCASICIHYGLSDPVNHLIEELTKITHLSEKSFPPPHPEENIRRDIPITQITIEKKEEAINISDMAVYFGRDFKAQLAAVVLFRLIKKADCKVSHSWDGIVKIILTLLENCLINPNLFCEFQKKVNLSPLAKVKPRYIIQGTKPLNNSGILSSFSSFLKGYSDEPPEPSDQEIESTLSTIDCVRSINVPGIFDTVSKGTQVELKQFVDLLLNNLPTFSDDKKRFYESEILFLFEVGVCFSLIVSETEVTDKLIDKLVEYMKTHVSKKGYMRLSTYLFLLARQSDKSHEKEAAEAFERINSFDRELVTKHGASLVKSLFSLVDQDSKSRPLIQKESFWDFLKLAGSSAELADEILDFLHSIVQGSSDEVSDQNHILLLGLLDEVSSLGAVGAQWEQAKDSGRPVEKSKLTDGTEESKNVQKLIKVSIRSIDQTGLLGSSSRKLSYPLIQALAHQCFNPCREVRSHAITVLQNTLLSGALNDNFTALGIYEYGLFPLLAELEKEEVIFTDKKGFPETHSQILNLVSKVFLHHHHELNEEDRKTVWLGIVNHFVRVNTMNSTQEKSYVKESSLEVMKNMILVLQNEFLIPENKELWDSTWKSLQEVYPDLEKELAK